MRLRLGWRRTGGALLAVFATAAAVAIPSSPAHASGFPAAGGSGWSWSYRYTSGTDLSVAGGLPGVFMRMSGTDVNGNRQLFPLVLDTARDGFCAGLAVYDSGGNQVIAPLVTCDGQSFGTTRTFRGDATVLLFQANAQGTVSGGFYFETIPGFDGDPGMRTAGTGFHWNYTDATNFAFDMAIPGASVQGTGFHETSRDARGARFTVAWTGGSSCVQADIQGEGDPVIPGGNTGVACPFGSPGSGSLRNMHNGVVLRAFAGSHALSGRIPMPFTFAS
jgi:hypothetical protein